MSVCDVTILGGGLEAVAIAEACARQGRVVRVVLPGDLGEGLDLAAPEPVDAQASLCARARRPRLHRELRELLHLAGPLVHKRALLWPGQAARPVWLDRCWRRAAQHRGAVAAGLDPSWASLTADELARQEPALAPWSAGAIQTTTWVARWLPILVYTAQRACEYDTQFFFDCRLISVEPHAQGYQLRYRPAHEPEQILRARCVVNAAGDRLASVAKILGLDLPVRPSRRVFARLARRLSQSCVALPQGGWLTPMDDETLVGPLPATPEIPPQPQRVSEAERRRWDQWSRSLGAPLAGVPLVGWWIHHQPVLGHAASPHPDVATPQLLDHREHGRPGLWSVLPGLALEHRGLAREVAERVLSHLQHDAPFKGAAPLAPALGAASVQRWAEQFDQSAVVIRGLYRRHGSRAHQVLQAADEHEGAARLICRCRGITAAEIEMELQRPGRGRLIDLMRRCGLGQGACNGMRCLLKAVQLWRELGPYSASEMRAELAAARQQAHEARWPHFEGAAAVSLMMEQMGDDLPAPFSGSVDDAPEVSHEP